MNTVPFLSFLTLATNLMMPVLSSTSCIWTGQIEKTMAAMLAKKATRKTKLWWQNHFILLLTLALALFWLQFRLWCWPQLWLGSYSGTDSHYSSGSSKKYQAPIKLAPLQDSVLISNFHGDVSLALDAALAPFPAMILAQDNNVVDCCVVVGCLQPKSGTSIKFLTVILSACFKFAKTLLIF